MTSSPPTNTEIHISETTPPLVATVKLLALLDTNNRGASPEQVGPITTWYCSSSGLSEIKACLQLYSRNLPFRSLFRRTLHHQAYTTPSTCLMHPMSRPSCCCARLDNARLRSPSIYSANHNLFPVQSSPIPISLNFTTLRPTQQSDGAYVTTNQPCISKKEKPKKKLSSPPPATTPSHDVSSVAYLRIDSGYFLLTNLPPSLSIS